MTELLCINFYQTTSRNSLVSSLVLLAPQGAMDSPSSPNAMKQLIVLAALKTWKPEFELPLGSTTNLSFPFCGVPSLILFFS